MASFSCSLRRWKQCKITCFAVLGLLLPGDQGCVCCLRRQSLCRTLVGNVCVIVWHRGLRCEPPMWERTPVLQGTWELPAEVRPVAPLLLTGTPRSYCPCCARDSDRVNVLGVHPLIFWRPFSLWLIPSPCVPVTLC